MANINKILTTNIKYGLVRDLDEEAFSEACTFAADELEEETGETPTEAQIQVRAVEILRRKK